MSNENFDSYQKFLDRVRSRFPTKESFVKFLKAFHSYFVRKTGIKVINKDDIKLEDSPIFDYWNTIKSTFSFESDNLNWFFFIMNTIIENQESILSNELTTENLKIKNYNYFIVRVNDIVYSRNRYEYKVPYGGYADKNDLENGYYHLVKDWFEYQQMDPELTNVEYSDTSYDEWAISKIIMKKSIDPKIYE
jgi:hypothetical protein